MEFISFSVRNYRSITDAHKINFKNYTVLLGKNNEGKSNILRALSICMGYIERLDRVGINYIRNRRIRGYSDYDWKRDFPVSYQNRKKGLKTIFKLEFALTKEEVSELKTLLRTRINTGSIILEIKIGSDNRPEIKLPKRGTSSLTKKSDQVLKYIASKITYNYIPAMRKDTDAMQIISRNIQNELDTIEKTDEYKNALKIIKDIQMDKFNEISKNVTSTLREFIPSIKSVEIAVDDDNEFLVFDRNISLLIDDGVKTDLESKGDGVKSLVALAMLKTRTDNEKKSIIAIDEPEAHLHPGAINELVKNLKKLSENNQVIISTHNQLFANRESVKDNIIVNNRKASPAKHVAEIRECLGVKVSDNLLNAQHVLVVEGETDKIILEKIFYAKSEKIKKSLQNGILTIQYINGADKLSYHLNLLNQEFCNYIVLLDKDKAGKGAIEKAINSNLLTLKQAFFTNCIGMNESEIEDYFYFNIYSQEILNSYGVNLNEKSFRSNKKKWSDRMKDAFESQGKDWNEKLEKEIKIKVAKIIVSKKLEESIIEEKISPINSLITSMEDVLKN